MPLAPPSNNYLFGIAKQVDESTLGTVADYSVPVYSSNVGPTADDRVVQVTDASAVQGDHSRGPVSWQGTVEVPCYGTTTGRVLQAVFPTDTITGAGPYTHTYSGLGNTPPWMSFFTQWPGAGNERQRFGKGIVNEFSIVASADETPARFRFGGTGQTYDNAIAWTATVAETLADGYFTLQATGADIKADFDSPNASPSVPITNVQQVELNVEIPVAGVPTADGITVRQLSRGLIAPGGSATLIWNDWDAYHASWYGAVAGTSASNVNVYGALLLTFKHTVQSGWLLTVYVPKVRFAATQPEPDPSAGVLTLPVTLEIDKPTSGSHIQPVLVNGRSTAY